MPEIAKSQPGSFCWFELGTTDAKAARQFYADLFGWTTQDNPMGPGMVYSMLQLGGKDVGGLYDLPPDMREQGVPSHWLAYVATDSADDTAARVKAAGGTIVNGPFDVMEHGRMAASGSSESRTRPAGPSWPRPTTRPRARSTRRRSAGSRT